MRMIVIGSIGSDAGYWWFDGHGWHHGGGWEAERLSETARALAVLSQATHFKTPGLADAISKPLAELVQRELGHLGNDKAGATTVVIVNAAAR